ncbi:unnamed protein product [Paramecium octaurelia]|uniref:Uncharacterized protein n=1 Tax=Paramecium octaurelia TaxID=43137 RepID=A0A8S1YKQ6_PAROT|nr:unnamed protein product [Paramecium octaurelia]
MALSMRLKNQFQNQLDQYNELEYVFIRQLKQILKIMRYFITNVFHQNHQIVYWSTILEQQNSAVNCYDQALKLTQGILIYISVKESPYICKNDMMKLSINIIMLSK